MVDNMEKIKEESIRFFASLYSKEQRDRPLIKNLFNQSLELAEAEALEGPFFTEEIKKVVFDMAKDKSPGPDGFTMCFYHTCWDIIKDDLMKVFFEFFQSGIINIGVNATFLVLIPKKEGALGLSDYRPISLVTSL